MEHAHAATEDPVHAVRAAAELKKLRDGYKLSPDLVFRDPYMLDFLGLKDTYS